MNTPVSFELAKLLKEKGFDSYTPLKYFSKKPSGYNIINWSENIPYNCEDIYSQLSLGYNKQTYFTWAPTIAEVVMWLYEKHGIWISVYTMDKWLPNGNDREQLFDYSLKQMKLGLIDIHKKPEEFDSPTEAYEAAIKHSLENLI